VGGGDSRQCNNGGGKYEEGEKRGKCKGKSKTQDKGEIEFK
jgi:hypothetical protein